MNDADREELFDLLIEQFEQQGLKWVTTEVTDLVAQGVEEQIIPAEWTGRGKPRQVESRKTRRDYTPLERVDLLLTAVSRVLLDGTKLEASIIEFFKSEQNRDQRSERAFAPPKGGPLVTEIDPPAILRFQPEPLRRTDDSDGFELGSSADIERREDAVQTLLETIDRVRLEASQ